jgi:acyl dehydratase
MTRPDAFVDLPALPAMGTQLLRAALARKRTQAASLPQVRLRARDVRPDAAQLARYRTACGFDADGFLPLTYPQVLAAPLHVALLGRKDFAYPVLGLIHVRNRIEQLRRLPENALLSVDAGFEAQREVPAGIELDLTTVVEAEGQVAWSATTTMLRRGAKRDAERRPRSGDEDAEGFAASRPASWSVPGGTGRRYARASGDYNPIHLSALTARPFGFPRAIAHGMWTLARCVAELGEAAQAERVALHCEFRRPLLLPSQVTFQTLRRDGGVDFRVASRDGKPHLLGALEPVPAGGNAVRERAVKQP